MVLPSGPFSHHPRGAKAGSAGSVDSAASRASIGVPNVLARSTGFSCIGPSMKTTLNDGDECNPTRRLSWTRTHQIRCLCRMPFEGHQATSS